MKFGIITLVGDNYGNKYQNYAVEQIFLKYGMVETYSLADLYFASRYKHMSIWEKLQPSYIKSVLEARLMYRFDINRTDKGILYNIVYTWINKKRLLALQHERAENFRKFSEHNLHISEKILDYTTVQDIDWIKNIDFFICGSDQIWNPTYSTTSELAFCSFAPEKTICISPSFGVAEIPEYRKEEYASWLHNIKFLSVREQTGQKMIYELTGRKAEVLIDPTMVLPKERWEQLSKKPAINLPKHYIVGYFLGRVDSNYKKQIIAFSDKMKLPVVMLFDIMTPEYYVMGPAEVLYIINHSDYVITDSFHGTVFSILFHKSFSVFNRNEGGASMNSRIETLLNKFGLQDRVGLCSADIDNSCWKNVDCILEKERKIVEEYLCSALKQ